MPDAIEEQYHGIKENFPHDFDVIRPSYYYERDWLYSGLKIDLWLLIIEAGASNVGLSSDSPQRPRTTLLFALSFEEILYF